MKQLLSLTLCLFALSSFAQEKPQPAAPAKQDSVVQITITRETLSAVLQAIDANVDSKKLSQEIISALTSSARLVAVQPPDEPKKKQ